MSEQSAEEVAVVQLDGVLHDALNNALDDALDNILHDDQDAATSTSSTATACVSTITAASGGLDGADKHLGHHHHVHNLLVVQQGELLNDTSVLEDKKAGEGGGYINMDAGGTPQQLLKGFSPLLVLTEVVGLVLVTLVAVWCGQKGFAWTSNPDLEFNWHPLLMVIALIFLNGNAILTFRVLRNNRKVLLKYIHGGIQLFTLPLIVIGLVAVFDSHNLHKPTPTPNLYSLHSWIGLGAVIMFFSQYVVGLTAFLFPGLSAEYRSFILPYHVFNGIAILALSVGASLIGLNEKAFFAIPNYGALPGEAVLINMIGVVMVVFALLVGLLVTKAEYKRTPLPEDGSPLLAAASRQ